MFGALQYLDLSGYACDSGETPIIINWNCLNKIDASCFLEIGIAQTNDLGDRLFIDIVLINDLTGCPLVGIA